MAKPSSSGENGMVVHLRVDPALRKRIDAWRERKSAAEKFKVSFADAVWSLAERQLAIEEAQSKRRAG